MNPVAQHLTQRLAAAGGWAEPADLARGVHCSAQLLEDELADLVRAGVAEFNERMRCYRLRGAPLARQALKQLVQRDEAAAALGQPPGPQRCVLGRATAPGSTAYRFGVAVRHDDPSGLMRYTMAELEAELQPGLEGQQALVNGLCAVDKQLAASA
jgi:hypothetical protein